MADEKQATIIDQLNALYRACNTAAEQVRRLKIHILVRSDLCRLVHGLSWLLHCGYCRQDHCHEAEHREKHEHQRKCGSCIPCWAMHTLRRIERLGGEAQSGINDVVVTDDIGAALGLVRYALQAIADKAGDIGDSDDELSKKVAGDILCSCDQHLERIEAEIRLANELKTDYLITLK